MATTTTSADPSALIESLDPELIVAQLQDLDRQGRALRLLLRAARARHRQREGRDQSVEVSGVK
jgi:hypothetical protein